MKIATWNIRHGGSKRRFDCIVETLLNHDADVILLTEFRLGKSNSVQKALLENGWMHQLTYGSLDSCNSVLLASRLPVNISQTVDVIAKHRWIEVTISDLSLIVFGIHVPAANDQKWNKPQFWDSVIEFATEKVCENALIIGDLNTGLKIDAEGAPFKCSEYINELRQLGWTDAWSIFTEHIANTHGIAMQETDSE